MPKNGKPVTIRFSHKTAKAVLTVLENAYSYKAVNANEILVAIETLNQQIQKRA